MTGDIKTVEFNSFREREKRDKQAEMSLSDEQQQEDEGVCAVWMELEDNTMEIVVFYIIAVCKEKIT